MQYQRRKANSIIYRYHLCSESQGIISSLIRVLKRSRLSSLIRYLNWDILSWSRGVNYWLLNSWNFPAPLGSTDGSVCLWSLDDYTLLNTVPLPSPVTMLSVSSDSVFLLIACDNNQMYLYTLATGTEIHCLKGHKSKVRRDCNDTVL